MSDFSTDFSEGYVPYPYQDDPDRATVVENLASLRAWANIYSKIALPGQRG
jgi:hypothetical protein